MKRVLKLISLILAMSMLIGMMPTVFAAEPIAGPSTIRFSAIRYNVMENEGSYDITVLREGGNATEIDVAFKTADILLEYGVDYTVEVDGETLAKTEGIAPNAGDFREDAVTPSDLLIGSTAEIGESAEESAEKLKEQLQAPMQKQEIIDENGEVTEAKPPQTEKPVTAAENVPESVSEPTESKGTAILDAQAALLNLPTEDGNTREIEQEEASVTDMMREVSSFFQETQGAYGVLHFGAGETQKKFTIHLIDNNIPETDKIILLSLMGVNGDDDAALEPNPTATVNVLDDEPYEKPVITPDTTFINLDREFPNYQLLLQRTAGVDYYTTIYVSTVTGTALEGADYDPINNAKLTFAPGETEKIISVSGKRFDEDRAYGIRLWSDGTNDITKDYIDVNLMSETASEQAARMERTANFAKLQNDSVKLESNEVVLGDESYPVQLDAFRTNTGLYDEYHEGSTEYTWGINTHRQNYPGQITPGPINALEVYTRKNSTEIATLKRHISTYGLKSIDVLWKCDEWNGVNDNDDFGSHVSLSTPEHAGQNNNDFGDLWHEGPFDWQTETLNVNQEKLSSDAVIKVIAKSWKGKCNDPDTWVGGSFNFHMNKYSFKPAASQYFYNYLYDYVDNTLTYLPMQESGSYSYKAPDPGFWTIYTGQIVDAFYPRMFDGGEPAKPVSRGELLHGIELSEVWVAATGGQGIYTQEDVTPAALNERFAELNKSDDRSKPVNETFRNENTYRLPAGGTYTLNQTFLKNAFAALDSNCSDGVLKLMPVYTRDPAVVKVYTGPLDSNGKPTLTVDGLYDAKTAIRDGDRYYNEYKFSLDSKLRIKVTNAAAGYQFHDYTITYGGKKVTGSNRTQDTLVFDNEVSTIHMDSTQMSIYPNAKETKFFVKYNPSPYLMPPLSNGEPASLYGVVMEGINSTMTPEGGERTPMFTDENGILDYNATPVSPGMLWTFRSFPPKDGSREEYDINPDKYYTVWLNGTGDTNENGVIDPEEENDNVLKVGDAGYEEIIGNFINGTVTQNSPKLYYFFRPVESNAMTMQFSGRVRRVKGNFMTIADNKDEDLIREDNLEPVGGKIGVANTETLIDPHTGIFTANITGIPTSGRISFMVDAYDMDKPYYGTTLLQRMNIILPAYDTFKPQSYSAAYSGANAVAVSGKSIEIVDSVLTLTAQVRDAGTLKPRAAKFYHYDALRKEYTDMEEYDKGAEGKGNIDNNIKPVVSFDSVDNTATLTFNPYYNLDTGDRIYVEFYDQFGNAYTMMELGYSFAKPPELGYVILGLLGADTFADGQDAMYDLIENPLGNIDFGYANLTPDGSESDGAGHDMVKYKAGEPGKATAAFNQNVLLLKQKEKEQREEKREPTKEEKKEKKEGTEDAAKKAADAGNDKNDKDKKSKYATRTSFSFDFSMSLALSLGITCRLVEENGELVAKNYFESASFYASIDLEFSASVRITLGLGFKVFVGAGIACDVTAIYQMKTKYEGDPFHNNPDSLVEFSPATFGMFDDNPRLSRVVYVFVRPDLHLDLGLKWTVFKLSGSAHFKFNMEFEFGVSDGAEYEKRYGIFYIEFDYSFKVMGLTVYHGVLTPIAQSVLFQYAADDFDDITPDLSLLAAQDVAENNIERVLKPENADIRAVTESREYLNAPSEWIENNIMQTQGDGQTGFTVEKWEKTHVLGNSEAKLVAAGNNRYMLFYVGDAGTGRADIDKTAIFYRTLTDGQWSEEKRLDPASENAVGYLNVQTTEKGIIVSWSEANGTLTDCVKRDIDNNPITDENGKEVYDAKKVLSKLDIRAMLISKETMATDSTIFQVTRTTPYDEYGDLNARFVYDKNTQKVFVVYQKASFKSMDTMDGLSAESNDQSTIAYRTGTVTPDGTVTLSEKYTPEEEQKLKEALSLPEGTDLSEVFYGQRFIDTRLNHSEAKLPRIQDFDAAHLYNRFDGEEILTDQPGYASVVYLVDGDGKLETENDKNVYEIFYDFANDRFTASDPAKPEYIDILRLTEKEGAYIAPKLAEHNNKLYFFISVTGNIRENDVEEEKAGIAGVSLTELQRSGVKILVEDSGEHYYRAERHIMTKDTVDSDGNIIPGKMMIYPQAADYFIETNGGVTDYCGAVDHDENGNEIVYLVWTMPPKDAKSSDNQVFVSVFDQKESEETGENYFAWSKPFMITGELTDADGKELDKEVYYSGITTAIAQNGSLMLAGNRAPFITPSGSDGGKVAIDENNASLVYLEHEPISIPEFAEENPISINSEYLYRNSIFRITATLHNNGDKHLLLTEQNPLVCDFYAIEDTGDGQTAERYLGQSRYVGAWGADNVISTDLAVDAYRTLYAEDGTVAKQGADADKVQGLKAVASLNGATYTCEQPIEHKAELLPGKDNELYLDSEDRTQVHFNISVKNNGNADITNGKVTFYRSNPNMNMQTASLYSDAEEEGFIKEKELPCAIQSLEEKRVEGVLPIPDEWYDIDENGDGAITFRITVADGNGAEVSSFDRIFTKAFDPIAINLLRNVSDVRIKGNDYINAKLYDKIKIPVTVHGAQPDEYKIMWTSDSDSVRIAEDGTPYAANVGKANLTGYVIPKTDRVVFDPEGRVLNNDSIKYIPANLLKKVSATVKVAEGNKPTGGGGNTPSEGFTPSTEPQQQEQEPQDIPEIENLPFTDVTNTDWFYDAVKYVYDNKIMNGTSDTTFEPYSEVTRGMFATVIYRLEGEPAFMNDNIFEDVKSGEYYEKAVVWAQGKGIVNGTSETTFEPDKLITREEMATMLYRYIQYLGGGFQGGWAFPLAFSDADQVSDWAYEAMCYVTMPSVGLMQGMEDGTLQPKNNTNRAELATVLMRY